MKLYLDIIHRKLNQRLHISGYLNRYILLGADLSLSVFSSLLSYVSFMLFLNQDLNSHLIWEVMAASSLISLFYLLLFQTYRGIIRHTSVAELMRIVYYAGCKDITLFVFAGIYKQYVGGLLTAQVLGDFFITSFLMITTRALIANLYYHLQSHILKGNGQVLVYSVSDAAITLISYLRNNNKRKYNIAGFLTDDVQFSGDRIYGFPVYYAQDTQAYQELFARLNIREILFTDVHLLHDEQSPLLKTCIENHINLQVAPLFNKRDRRPKVQLRNIQIEDLLGREEIAIQIDSIKQMLVGRTVMITGAAGSIGSELCRQLCMLKIPRLILLDNAETPMYHIHLELEENYTDTEIIPVIGDVRSPERMRYVFQKYAPAFVFHAAAYKHVPMMEDNPCEAIRTNVGGTRNVADLAVEYGVERFIMISTDKAVNPSNVMGASKRIAEIYIQSLSTSIQEKRHPGKTKFITTRFGNVLGSNGSVIPRFREQLVHGGPLTVTHPDIIRYFMTIPEACRLVLEACLLGKGNEIFVFDMGKPVRIADMARRMIELAGYTPDKDIEIIYTGLRPGEKLYEELLYNQEDITPTTHKKISRAHVHTYRYEEIEVPIDRLCQTALSMDPWETVRQMKAILPEFVSQHSIYSQLDKEQTPAS